jgi:hypothetical protein
MIVQLCMTYPVISRMHCNSKRTLQLLWLDGGQGFCFVCQFESHHHLWSESGCMGASGKHFSFAHPGDGAASPAETTGVDATIKGLYLLREQLEAALVEQKEVSCEIPSRPRIDVLPRFVFVMFVLCF